MNFPQRHFLGETSKFLYCLREVFKAETHSYNSFVIHRVGATHIELTAYRFPSSFLICLEIAFQRSDNASRTSSSSTGIPSRVRSDDFRWSIVSSLKITPDEGETDLKMWFSFSTLFSSGIEVLLMICVMPLATMAESGLPELGSDTQTLLSSTHQRKSFRPSFPARFERRSRSRTFRTARISPGRASDTLSVRRID